MLTVGEWLIPLYKPQAFFMLKTLMFDREQPLEDLAKYTNLITQKQEGLPELSLLPSENDHSSSCGKLFQFP